MLEYGSIVKPQIALQTDQKQNHSTQHGHHISFINLALSIRTQIEEHILIKILVLTVHH